ncbi:hypothetical protein F4680DRAFT_469093 [Xylaria scruposa]|nr:hypothetical protein F4680DRAFT_469093 [Xylaria scruposa]
MTGAVPDVLGLPVEVNMNVLSFALLNSSKDILNLMLSCKVMYSIFKHNRTSILLAFLSQMDPKELAIATAHYHATIALWTFPKDLEPISKDQTDYVRKIAEFCERHLSKQGTELRVPFHEFTLPMVAHIRDIHFTIRRIATEVTPKIICSTKEWPSPSPVEMTRISKSLYIMDLVGLLLLKTPFTVEQHESSDMSKRDLAFSKFWSYFAPWETEQVAIVFETLYHMILLCPGSQLGGSNLSADLRFLAWKGMKGLDHVIRNGVSEDDKLLHSLLRTDPHRGVIREIPCDSLAHWLEGSFHDATLLRKIIERYDADIGNESARVLLCRCAGLAISGKPLCDQPLSDISPWNNNWKLGTKGGWPIFFDLDHLLVITEGRLPTLTHLIELIPEQRGFQWYGA